MNDWTTRRLERVTHTILLAAVLAAPTFAQNPVKFSLDPSSPTAGMTGGPGSILGPMVSPPVLGPLAPPNVLIPPEALGLFGPPWQVDAFSHGMDLKFFLTGNVPLGIFWFSIDRRALGRNFPASWPTIRSESSIGSEREACQDLFVDLGVPSLPAGLPGPGNAGRHVGVLDGDGLPSTCSGFAYPGLGLIEPGPEDNVDAFDSHRGAGGRPTDAYFSLSPNSASVRGFVGGDVIKVDLAGIVELYASAYELGLDRIEGPNSDNLDALALWDDGDGVFELPRAWNQYGHRDTDRLLFSVRRGSAIIGHLDGYFGIPIVEGDILMPPPAGYAGLPGIFVAAEHLGLRARRGLDDNERASDDLVALDVANAPLFDCNENGVEDAVDIALGGSADADMNGIPDECVPPM